MEQVPSMNGNDGGAPNSLDNSLAAFSTMENLSKTSSRPVSPVANMKRLLSPAHTQFSCQPNFGAIQPLSALRASLSNAMP